MRRLHEKKDVFRDLLESPRRTCAILVPSVRSGKSSPVTQFPDSPSHSPRAQKLPESASEPVLRKGSDPQSRAVSPRLLELINSVTISVKHFEQVKRDQLHYHLATPPMRARRRKEKAPKREIPKLEIPRMSEAARGSQEVFLGFVEAISRYDGSSTQNVRNLKEYAEFHPFAHPRAPQLFSLLRSSQHLEVQRLVMEDRSVLKVQDSVGATALHMAVKRNDAQMVEMLLALGAEVDCTDIVRCKQARRTPLYLAARKRHLEIARVLLQSGADPLFATMTGATPLSASEKGSKLYYLLTSRLPKHPIMT